MWLVDLLWKLKEANVSTILVVAGVVFIFVALAATIGFIVRFSPKRQVALGSIGATFLILGMAIASVAPPTASTPTPTPTATGTATPVVIGTVVPTPTESPTPVSIPTFTPVPKISPSPTQTPTPVGPVTRFDFESGTTQGWRCQSVGNTMACTTVAASSDQRHQGQFSLKMMADLRGGHSTLAKAEVWIDLRGTEAIGGAQSLNLQGRRVTAWIYAPAAARGDTQRPNGFQLFFKDTEWRNWYGPWENVIGDAWQLVDVTLGVTNPAVSDQGFAPTAVRAIGVKIAIGDGSTATYSGPIFIDSIVW